MRRSDDRTPFSGSRGTLRTFVRPSVIGTLWVSVRSDRDLVVRLADNRGYGYAWKTILSMGPLTVATPAQTTFLRTLLTLLRDRGTTPWHVAIHTPSAPPDGLRGWGMLDPIAALPTCIDLASVPTAHVPHLLSDLRRVQRLQRPSPLPLMLVDPTNYAQQRLLASSDVLGVGAASHLPATIIPDLLDFLAEVEVLSPTSTAGRPWFGMRPRHTRLFPTPDWISLLAALSLAPSLSIAAAWSGFAPRSVTRMLDQIHAALDLPPSAGPRRHRPDQWFQILLDQIATP